MPPSKRTLVPLRQTVNFFLRSIESKCSDGKKKLVRLLVCLLFLQKNPLLSPLMTTILLCICLTSLASATSRCSVTIWKRLSFFSSFSFDYLNLGQLSQTFVCARTTALLQKKMWTGVIAQCTLFPSLLWSFTRPLMVTDHVSSIACQIVF